MSAKGEYKNNEYWYDLPESAIAQAPASPRDASKLLVYDTQTNKLSIDVFSNLATHLPSSTTITLNDAKVVPARVTLTKETGGHIVVLFLINEWIAKRQGPIPCFLDRRGRVGDKLYFADRTFVTIQKQEEQLFYLLWEGAPEDLLAKLDNYGTMPIPPYIKHSPLSRDELLEKYQTIFAKKTGSSAAPTASLHFTPEVFASLEAKGIKKQYITLHVGLGTFAPLTEENLRTKTLHKEAYEIPEDVMREIKIKNQNQKMGKTALDITAVGTTVVRTLESLVRVIPSEEGIQSKIHNANIVNHSLDSRLRGNDNAVQNGTFMAETNLFIARPYEFKAVNHLITNFHLPGSSLMMLVDAFLASKGAKRRILELYRYAIEHHFRFYSFGDAMLIL
jgi:S-adenosylmethionine:tRNA ribosyltransferase-isomerase